MRRNAHAIELPAYSRLLSGPCRLFTALVATAALMVVRWFYSHLPPLSNGPRQLYVRDPQNPSFWVSAHIILPCRSVVKPEYRYTDNTMTRRDILALGPLVALTGCGPEPKVEKKAAEPVTGLHALYGMYTNARTWAQDLMVVNLRSIAITQVPAVPGKAAAWQAVFSSQSLGKQRTYTSSVYDASTSLREGIFADAPMALASDAKPFLIAGARTDTDQAWETALKHGEDYAKKNPGMTISFILELSRKMNEPVWRVIWGESPASSALSILIDAGSGQYLQTEN
jgi:hypothetical protein